VLRQRGLSVLLLSIGWLALAPAAQAEDKDEDECLRLFPGIRSPVEMVRCTFDIEGSEERLRSAYVALQAQEGAEKAWALKKAQEAWAAYRKATCDYEAGGNPGSTGHSSDFIACTATMNITRADALERQLKQ
jgi:uncharacterized protein YecT (DUF1311 family)